MSQLRRRGLQIDDPLSPGRPAPPGHVGPEPVPPPSASPNGDRRVADMGPDGSPPVGSVPEPARGEGAREAAGPPAAESRSTTAIPPSVQADGGAWREWTGPTGVGSFRLPHELLLELGDAARELQLPVGMIVTAAITRLLDQPPDTIAALVDRAEDARFQGRRVARRRQSKRSSRQAP